MEIMNPNSYLTELFDQWGPPLVYIDFDGTISKRDVIDEILKEFADNKWLEIEKEWTSGRIGSRECLRKQLALVRATPGELGEFIDGIDLDDGFEDLLSFCREIDVPVRVVSDGFDHYIERMIGRAVRDTMLLENVSIYANNLTPYGSDRWRPRFPFFRRLCGDGCATCKPRVMEVTNPTDMPTVFVGDGLSDRFAAAAADIVFAKDKLKNYCHLNNITMTEYGNLSQVAKYLDEAYETFAIAASDKGAARWLKKAA